MKFTNDRPFFDPDKAARRLLEHAHAFEPIQDGRIYIEKLNGPFLFREARAKWRTRVPDLTCNAGIKLNTRISLPPIYTGLA
jgi:hypothetical protein